MRRWRWFAVAEPLAMSKPPVGAGGRDGVVHVVVRAEDDGAFFVRSPQVPGLAYGAASLAEVRSDLQGVLAFALDSPGPFDVVEHHEWRFDVGEREVVVRLAADEHETERHEVYERLARAVAVPDQADALLDAPADAVGEVLYLCAVPSDRVRWIAAQLDRSGAATLAVAVADELLLTYRVHVDDPRNRRTQPVRHREGETVADIMHTRPIVRPVADDLAVS
jgi:predicted RNase H-like HicB family nuclease